MNDIIDREDLRDTGVKINFETGPSFIIPEDLTVREAAAYLLTPERDMETEKILRKIHEAGEKWAKNNTQPEFQILINGEKADFNTTIKENSTITLKEKA